MNSELTPDQVRAAKEILLSRAEIAMVGIGVVRRGETLGLKVNVASESDADLIPKEIGDVPIFEVEVVGSASALEGTVSPRPKKKEKSQDED